jgi:hypothetical protein
VGNSYFAWENAVDAATLSVANLASFRKGRVWRSLATTSYFIANFASLTNVRMLALGGCTLGETDQIQHRLYAGANATGTLLLDTTVDADVFDGYGLHLALQSASYSALSWRCDIVASSRGAEGYFDIARAWAGPVWNPSIGISYPWEETWNDDADNVRGGRSGALFIGDGAQYRSAKVSLEFMSEADKLQAKELARVAGRRSQALIIPNNAGDPPREAILGHLDQMQPIRCSIPTAPAVYEQSFSIIQDL